VYVLCIQIFVLCVTMTREAFDDFCRFLRDREINKQKYKKLTQTGVVSIESAKIKVGDLIIVEKVTFRFGHFCIATAVSSHC